MRRRRFLRLATAAGTFSLAGCSESADDGRDTGGKAGPTVTDSTGQAPTESATTPTAATRTTTATTTRTTERSEPTADDTTTETRDGTATTEDANAGTSADPGTGRSDFVWAVSGLWQDERARENLFAYAGRHDLAVMLSHPSVEHADVGERLAEPLTAASQHGVEAWVNTGVLEDLTAEQFVNDADARATHLDRLGRAASTYAEHVPEGRLVLWEEAPIRGEWVEGGAWNDRALANLRDLGPLIFATQKATIAEAAPGLDVGIFLHFPYIVDSKQPEVFAGLMDDLRERDALPGFTFADFYRGWYEKDAGPAVANRAVRSLITNAREHADGEVLYMGGAHTINPRHTPSKQSIRMDLRASTSVEADGLGWYARTAYRRTEQGFDPFVPNRADPGGVPDTPRANTTTFARDRYQYAYAALRESRPSHDPADAFDLWLVGDGFSFYDHRLLARTRTGEWALVGDFDGYPDGVHAPTAARTGVERPDVSIFRGLDRERFLSSGGDLDLAVETRSESTGATLRSALVTPSGTGGYLAEPAAARVLADRGSIDAFALGSARADATLRSGETVRVGLSVADTADRPFRALRHPAHATAIERLHAIEARERFDPGARFDLWIEGRGLDAIDRPGERLSVPGGSSGTDSRRYLADASVTITTAADGAVAYGLDRDALLDRVGTYGVVIEDGARTPGTPTTARATSDGGGVSLRAVYAMPYFGSRNFMPATRAVATIAADRAAARTFSLKNTRVE